MYPYLTIGPWHPGTFGLLLWLAAVIAAVVLHKNFVRNGVDADALNVVALVLVSGILGAKLWHELQDIPTFVLAIKRMGAPGWHHPLDILGRVSDLVPRRLRLVWWPDCRRGDASAARPRSSA